MFICERLTVIMTLMIIKSINGCLLIRSAGHLHMLIYVFAGYSSNQRKGEKQPTTKRIICKVTIFSFSFSFNLNDWLQINTDFKLLYTRWQRNATQRYHYIANTFAKLDDVVCANGEWIVFGHFLTFPNIHKPNR